jgi:hypothetical protein
LLCQVSRTTRNQPATSTTRKNLSNITMRMHIDNITTRNCYLDHYAKTDHITIRNDPYHITTRNRYYVNISLYETGYITIRKSESLYEIKVAPGVISCSGCHFLPLRRFPGSKMQMKMPKNPPYGVFTNSN